MSKRHLLILLSMVPLFLGGHCGNAGYCESDSGIREEDDISSYSTIGVYGQEATGADWILEVQATTTKLTIPQGDSLIVFTYSMLPRPVAEHQEDVSIGTEKGVDGCAIKETFKTVTYTFTPYALQLSNVTLNGRTIEPESLYISDGGIRCAGSAFEVMLLTRPVPNDAKKMQSIELTRGGSYGWHFVRKE